MVLIRQELPLKSLSRKPQYRVTVLPLRVTVPLSQSHGIPPPESLSPPQAVTVSYNRIIVSPTRNQYRVPIADSQCLPYRDLVSPQRVTVSPHRVTVSPHRVTASSQSHSVPSESHCSLHRLTAPPHRITVSSHRVLVSCTESYGIPLQSHSIPSELHSLCRVIMFISESQIPLRATAVLYRVIVSCHSVPSTESQGIYYRFTVFPCSHSGPIQSHSILSQSNNVLLQSYNVFSQSHNVSTESHNVPIESHNVPTESQYPPHRVKMSPLRVTVSPYRVTMSLLRVTMPSSSHNGFISPESQCPLQSLRVPLTDS